MKLLVTVFIIDHPNIENVPVMPMMRTLVIERNQPINSNQDLENLNLKLKEAIKKNNPKLDISHCAVVGIVPLDPINEYINQSNINSEVLHA
jgi:hypothetical protein